MGEPRVGLIAGRSEDVALLREVAAALEAFGVESELRALSPHHRPDAVREYARTAVERGLRVLLAAADGAALLPTLLAASTTLPVVALPLGPADGLLAALAEGPGGFALVGPRAADGAAALVVRILALDDRGLQVALEQDRGRRWRADAEADSAAQAGKGTTK